MITATLGAPWRSSSVNDLPWTSFCPMVSKYRDETTCLKVRRLLPGADLDPFDGDVAAAVGAAADRRVQRHRRRLDPWPRVQAIQQVVEELDRALAAIAGPRRAHAHQQHVRRVEPGLHGQNLPQAVDEQAGSHGEQHRERHLRNHQSPAQPCALAGDAARVCFEGRGNVHADRAARRGQPEEQRRHGRDADSEEQHAPIGAEVEQDWCLIHRDQPDQQARSLPTRLPRRLLRRRWPAEGFPSAAAG